MKLLGIDTASGIASVAVVEGDHVLAERHSETAGHRADLLVLVDAACRAAGIAPRELDAIAIGAGPGSFTGLRIGMATAKGIAFAAGRPLWAVSSLSALAHDELGRDPAGVVVGVLDARRGEVYAGAYRREGASTIAIGVERVLPPADLVAFGDAARTGSERVRFTGDARAAYPELATLDATWEQTPSGAAIAQLAYAGSRSDILVSGAPTYIRPSEAEVKYPDGVPGALRKR